jgi:membrane protease YdiL (CAAX protease family)
VSGRLVAWLVLVGAQILLNYSSRATSGKPDLFYGIFFGLVLLISRERTRELLALRQPRSWAKAAGTAGIVIVCVIVLELALEPALHPDREQGLTPTGWQSEHAAAFAASFVVLVFVGPFVEEATFRGLGYSLLVPYGELLAILATGLLFGLAHGLVEALPVLVALGLGLGYLRAKTDSLYPGFVLHALFNAIALTLAVA